MYLSKVNIQKTIKYILQNKSMRDRGKRSKTETDHVSVELQRQQSIFKNLHWQIKQKDKKITFLQRYYLDLKRVINKQQKEDLDLQQKISNYGKINHFSHKNSPSLLKKINDTSFLQRNKRLMPEKQSTETEQMNENQFLINNWRMMASKMQKGQ